MSRQSSSGTYDFFRDVALQREDFKLGTLELNGSKEVVELVGHTPCAIGYSGMGYATPAVKMLGIARSDQGPAISPSPVAALNRSYPIARPLYIFTIGEPRGRDQALHRLDSLRPRTSGRGAGRLRAASARRQALVTLARGSSSTRPLAAFALGRRRGARVRAIHPVCGVSAIVLVLGIFFFVVREAYPILFSPEFSLREFLFSVEWYPTSVTNVRYGVAAMIVGTLSVTALAMIIAVPFGIGAAIYISEFCAARTQGGPQDRHRAAGRDSVGRVGLHRPDGDERPHHPRCSTPLSG